MSLCCCCRRSDCFPPQRCVDAYINRSYRGWERESERERGRHREYTGRGRKSHNCHRICMSARMCCLRGKGRTLQLKQERHISALLVSHCCFVCVFGCVHLPSLHARGSYLRFPSGSVWPCFNMTLNAHSVWQDWVNGTKQTGMAVDCRKSRSFCAEAGPFLIVEPWRFFCTEFIFLFFFFFYKSVLMQTCTVGYSGFRPL